MGNFCIRDVTHDSEVQTFPEFGELNTTPRYVFSANQSPGFEFKDTTTATPTSSVGFRSEPALFDRSMEISKSIDNLSKQLDQSHVWQEGISSVAKFMNVLSETRLLEAKLENMKRKSRDSIAVSIGGLSDAPSDYLDAEKELEQKMDTIMEEMGVIKEEVEGLAKQAQGLSGLST